MRDYYKEFLEKKAGNVLVYEVSKVSKALFEDEKPPFDTFDTEQTVTNPENFFNTNSSENEINQFNNYADQYNAAVDRILSDADLFKDFETILDERKAILMIDGGMNEADAETLVCQSENMKRAAIAIANF